MQKIIKRYLAKFDEIERLGDGYIKSLPDSYNELESTVEAYLIDMYLEGYASVGYMLSDDVERQVNTVKMMSALMLIVAGESLYDRLRDYYEKGYAEGIKTVLDTEAHRMWMEGAEDRAIDGGAGTKQWITVGDMWVRDNHRYLAEVKIPIDADFYTPDGDIGKAPGMFGTAKNNVNCRCILKYE
jgi:hypothetical protein